MRWHQIAGKTVTARPSQSAGRRGPPGSNHQAAMRPTDARARQNVSACHVIEAGTIKPSGSLDADQLRKRSERLAQVQQRMRDEEARHAAKKRDLSAPLARPD
jgi:hypothetical protein